jgi:hypothetical protein
MRTFSAGLMLVVLSASASSAFGQRAVPGAPTADQNRALSIPTYTTRQTSFSIPFSGDRRVLQPVEVHLYTSTDGGTNWQLASRQPPNTRHFMFRARGDGEYLLASRTIDANQSAQPAASLRPELRVIVDTIQPQIEFSARAGEGGEVITSWQAFDQNLDTSSLKVEYQDGFDQPWKPVAVKTPRDGAVRTDLQGQNSWFPSTTAPTINVRAEVRDRAGNLSVVNRRVLLPTATARKRTQPDEGHAVTSDPFARRGVFSQGAVAWPSDNGTGQPEQPASQPPAQVAEKEPADDAVVNHTPLPPYRPGSLSNPPADDLADFPADSPQMPSTWPGQASSQAGPLDETTSPEPGTVAAPVSTRSTSPAMTARIPAGERPQMTNSRRFRLDYDVDSVGPSGVAEVQLWASDDGGQTWKLWGTDDDRTSPFDVEVNQEGVFGFRVVIVSQNGLAGRPPRAGDPADLWVGIDTHKPVVELTSAVYGEGHQVGRLIINWQADDAALDDRPITLQFSESPDGPWTMIASSLPNTGQYAWPADPQLPTEVYLRIEARDQAGNVGMQQLSDPIRVDGLVPKARIRGVLPIPHVDREAFRRIRQR